DLRAVFTRLPDIVGGDWRAFGHVGAADPDDFGLENVRPWIGRAINPEGLLIPCGRADHAQAPVVINVGGLQRDARELTHQVSFLNRQARAAQNGKSVIAVCGLNALNFKRDVVYRLVVRDGAKAALRRFIAFESSQQAVRVRALKVSLYAF